MAKTKKEKEPIVYERPLVFPLYSFEPLTLEERVSFREFIASPLGRKVVRNTFSKRPGVVVKGVSTSALEQTAQATNNRLFQIQGWEMFEAALFSQAETILDRPKASAQETYREPTQ